MHKFIQALCLVVCLACPAIGVAQSGNILTQTLTFRASRAINLVSSDTIAMEMNFKSFTNDRIEYIGPKGPNQVFDITSIEGIWTNIAQNGSITYHVTLSNQPGIITISRSADGVYFILDMTSAATGGMKMKFIINTIE